MYNVLIDSKNHQLLEKSDQNCMSKNKSQTCGGDNNEELDQAVGNHLIEGELRSLESLTIFLKSGLDRQGIKS